MITIAEENNITLLSEAPDEFLSKPNTDVVVKTVQQPLDERSICVVVEVLGSDPTLLKNLIKKLKRMCSHNQAITDTHKVALLLLRKETNIRDRLGYCDELTASNIVYRICESSKVSTEVYKDYGTPNQVQVTQEDLGKRPFRF